MKGASALGKKALMERIHQSLLIDLFAYPIQLSPVVSAKGFDH